MPLGVCLVVDCMDNVAQYIKLDAVAQLQTVTALLKTLLSEKLPIEAQTSIGLQIEQLELIDSKVIAQQKLVAPEINIGALIGNIVTEFALNCEFVSGWRLLKGFTDYSPALETSVRPNGLKLADNQQLIGQSFRCSALFGMAFIATQIDYEINKDAIQARADLAELIDFELNGLESEEVGNMLIEARDHAIGHLSGIINELSAIVEIETEMQTPSLLLAYSLYGDAKKANELVMLNGLSDSLLSPTKMKAAI